MAVSFGFIWRVNNILEDYIEEYEEDSEAKSDSIGGMRFDELSCHCCFTGQAEDNASHSSEHELSPTEPVNEQPIEEIARHCREVEESLFGQLNSSHRSAV